MNWKQIIGLVLPIVFIIPFMTNTKNILLNFSQTIIGKLLFICIILFYAEMNLKYGFIALVFIVFFYKIFFPIELIDSSVVISPALHISSFKTPSIHSGMDRAVMSGEGVAGSERLLSASSMQKGVKEVDGYPVVPLLIYQTWHSKILPPKMTDCVDKLKRDNPEFEHHLYDDISCRTFIKDNYDKTVLDAYDQLVPGAYKADLWRYCILYKTGGIYLDIKFQCEPGFSLYEFTKEPETFILDRPYGDSSTPLEVNLSILNSPSFYENLPKYTDGTWENKQIGLYNAVIATSPNNIVLFECIQQIVKNVASKNYGYNALYPTGPGLLGQIYFSPLNNYNGTHNNVPLELKEKQLPTKEYREKVKDIKYFNSINGTYIINKKRKILSQYPEYRAEQSIYTKKGPIFYYSDLWFKKKIYGTIL